MVIWKPKRDHVCYVHCLQLKSMSKANPRNTIMHHYAIARLYIVLSWRVYISSTTLKSWLSLLMVACRILMPLANAFRSKCCHYSTHSSLIQNLIESSVNDKKRSEFNDPIRFYFIHSTGLWDVIRGDELSFQKHLWYIYGKILQGHLRMNPDCCIEFKETNKRISQSQRSNSDGNLSMMDILSRF